jgi:hypothetical protein
MTSQLCPVCGSENIEITINKWQECRNCQAEWHEDKRVVISIPRAEAEAKLKEATRLHEAGFPAGPPHFYDGQSVVWSSILEREGKG